MTNNHYPRGALCTALCAILMATCAMASARSPQPSTASGTIGSVGPEARTFRDKCCCGTVEMINPDARLLRIRLPDGAAPLELFWNSQTRFIEGDRFVTAAELTKGATVTVWYHTPFFGKRFATKIVIERTAANPKQQRSRR